jgi:hypothetical protein
MPSRNKPVDRVRLENALLLLDEFARKSAALGAGNVTALNAAFAKAVGIAPSQWSRFKSGRDHIGVKLARQFESLIGQPAGWLDVDRASVTAIRRAAADVAPVNERERLAVAMFLAAFRADPEGVALKVLGAVADERMENPTAPKKALD